MAESLGAVHTHTHTLILLNDVCVVSESELNRENTRVLCDALLT